MTEAITGRCLCGAVSYAAEGPVMVAGHCFCEACRRSSGTSHCTHAMVPEAGFALTGTLTEFAKPADSGNVVTRCFCPTCGSAVLSRNSGMPGMVALRASSLDDMNLLSPNITVYAAQAPAWAHVDESNPVFPAEFPGLAEGKLPA